MEYVYSKVINNYQNRNSLLNTFSIVMLLLYYCLPVVNRFGILFRVGYTSFFVLLFYSTAITKGRGIFRSIIFHSLMVILFSSYQYIGQYSAKTDYIRYIYFSFLFWLPYIIMIYVTKINDRKLNKTTTLTIIFALTITCITTIRGLSLYPFASRFLATGQSELYDLSTYRSLNIGGYSEVYSLMFMIPALIYLFHIQKRHIFRRILLIIIIFLYIYCIIKAQYTIATLFAFTSLFLMLFKIFDLRRIFIIILSMLVFYFIFDKNIAFISYRIGEGLNDLGINMLANRFNDIANSILYPHLSGGAGDRYELYMNSLTTFFHNPIFGLSLPFDSDYSIGEHSELFDIAGSMGIVGLLFLVYFYTVFYKSVKKCISNTFAFNSFQYVYILTIIFSIINTMSSSPLIGVIVFLMNYCIAFPELSVENNNNVSS